jgi:hypothetical protein
MLHSHRCVGKQQRKKCNIGRCTHKGFAVSTSSGNRKQHLMRDHKALARQYSLLPPLAPLRIPIAPPQPPQPSFSLTSSSSPSSSSPSVSSSASSPFRASNIIDISDDHEVHPLLSSAASSKRSALSLRSDGPMPAKKHKTSASSSEGKIDEWCHPTVLLEQDFKSTWSTCVAVHSLPLLLMDSELLHNSFTLYRNDKRFLLPSRHQLRRDIHAQAQSMKETVVGRLRGTTPVTVGLDGWTNTNHNKVINIVPIVDGVSYYWCSIVNVLNRNTAEWQREPVLKAFNSLIEHNILVVAMVVDNEAVNGLLSVCLFYFRLLRPHQGQPECN